MSGCSSMLSFHKNVSKLLSGLKYITKAIPVSSFLNIDIGFINYQVVSHMVSRVNDHNLPMAFHIFNITNPSIYYYLLSFVIHILYNYHSYSVYCKGFPT